MWVGKEITHRLSSKLSIFLKPLLDIVVSGHLYLAKWNGMELVISVHPDALYRLTFMDSWLYVGWFTLAAIVLFFLTFTHQLNYSLCIWFVPATCPKSMYFHTTDDDPLQGISSSPSAVVDTWFSLCVFLRQSYWTRLVQEISSALIALCLLMEHTFSGSLIHAHVIVGGNNHDCGLNVINCAFLIYNI